MVACVYNHNYLEAENYRSKQHNENQSPPLPPIHTHSLSQHHQTHTLNFKTKIMERKKLKVLQPWEEHQEESNIAGFPGSTPDLIQRMST